MKRIVLSVLALLAFTACVSAGAPAGDPTWPEAQSVLNQGIKADGIKKIEINLKNTRKALGWDFRWHAGWHANWVATSCSTAVTKRVAVSL